MGSETGWGGTLKASGLGPDQGLQYLGGSQEHTFLIVLDLIVQYLKQK